MSTRPWFHEVHLKIYWRLPNDKTISANVQTTASPRKVSEGFTTKLISAASNQHSHCTTNISITQHSPWGLNLSLFQSVTSPRSSVSLRLKPLRPRISTRASATPTRFALPASQAGCKMARVYADVNQQMPRSYWDYDSVNITWGVLENYEVVRKIGNYVRALFASLTC